MTTLISLLGKSRQDAMTGYQTANYRFDDKVRTVPFFALALLDRLKPDKLILAGTSGSMWDVFFEQQQDLDETILQLSEAVSKNAVTQNMLDVQEKRLAEKLGIPVQCTLISHARDESEQTAILSQLAQLVDTDEEVVLDVTHGFRHLPMLALVAARYLAHVRGIQVSELYYGALEMTDAQTKETPVLRLGGMLKMLDWVEALAAYKRSGDYGIFSSLLIDDGLPPEKARQLEQGAFFERNSNSERARQALTVLPAALDEHEGDLGRLFSDQLKQAMSWSHCNLQHERELALADRYLEQQDYLRAIVFLYEGLISRDVGCKSGDLNDFRERSRSGKQLEKDNLDFRLLAYLRNALAHGVRPSGEQGNKAAKQAKRLLDDQRALVDELRRLRKTLSS